MTVGYADYARLSQQGGSELVSITGNVADGTVIFQGFVGSWPYIDVYINCNSSTDFTMLTFEWFSDATFTKLVGFKVCVRQGANASWLQYGNLSPWLLVIVSNKSTNPFPFVGLAIYATTGYSSEIQLASLDQPIFTLAAHINATTTQTFFIQHIQPGNAQFQILSGATSWFVNFQYYNWGTNAFVTLLQLGNTAFSNKFASIEFPMLDSPMQLQINNGDATSQNFFASWMSK